MVYQFSNSERTIQKYHAKFNAEKKEIEKEWNLIRFDSSNLEMIIKKGLKIAENASKLWFNRDFNDKQELQRLIFPEG